MSERRVLIARRAVYLRILRQRAIESAYVAVAVHERKMRRPADGAEIEDGEYVDAVVRVRRHRNQHARAQAIIDRDFARHDDNG